MKGKSGTEISFVRLTDVFPGEISEHMSDPRVTEHMPLATGDWDLKRCEEFVETKEERWRRDGLGHWAILEGGVYAGWGGFEKEDDAWDYGLVLRPGSFGLGLRITRKALAFARADDRIACVTFLLPPSRRHLGALARLGAEPAGEADFDGRRFLKFRMQTG